MSEEYESMSREQLASECKRLEKEARNQRAAARLGSDLITGTEESKLTYMAIVENLRKLLDPANSKDRQFIEEDLRTLLARYDTELPQDRERYARLLAEAEEGHKRAEQQRAQTKSDY